MRPRKVRDCNQGSTGALSPNADHWSGHAMGRSEAEFCNPASGWEKGQIEKNVQDARHRLWQPMPSFPSLAALNDWLEKRCQELWAQTPHGSHPGMISDAWAEEAQHLMPLPRLFDGFVEYAKRISPTCLIHLERNRYSVPASFANRPVTHWPNRQLHPHSANIALNFAASSCHPADNLPPDPSAASAPFSSGVLPTARPRSHTAPAQPPLRHRVPERQALRRLPVRSFSSKGARHRERVHAPQVQFLPSRGPRAPRLVRAAVGRVCSEFDLSVDARGQLSSR